MNTPIAAAALITLLAFLAHVFIGLKETFSTAPRKLTTPSALPRFETIERHWVQSLCAFQLVSVDLLALSVVLSLLAFTDWIEPKHGVALALAALYALWGAIWLFQLLALKRPAKDLLILGHWIFYFSCAGLIFWGARSF
jgi:uncharacterized membrane protein